MAYLLDANVFIEARRRHYGMDFCPAFWDWLFQANVSGRVFSIEKNVCIGVGVKCMTPYEMLRLERARFILGPQP